MLPRVGYLTLLHSLLTPSDSKPMLPAHCFSLITESAPSPSLWLAPRQTTSYNGAYEAPEC